MQRQSSMVRKVATTAEISQVPFFDRIVDVLFEIQRQVPTVQVAIQRQRFPQAQYLGKTVDVPVTTRRQSTVMLQRQVSHDAEHHIGFDTAMLTPYWKVRDSQSADWREAEFIR